MDLHFLSAPHVIIGAGALAICTPHGLADRLLIGIAEIDHIHYRCPTLAGECGTAVNGVSYFVTMGTVDKL